MSTIEDQSAFYQKVVPNQFNRTIEAQRHAARSDTKAAQLLEEMEAVRTSIRVEVTSASGLQIHRLAIENGEMTTTQKAERSPFFILGHDIEDFASLREQCGDSILGFLGAIAGLGDEMKLTTRRVRSLRDLKGSLAFHVAGPSGFALVASFGVDPPESEPRATLRLTPDIFDALRTGALDAQEAFFDEKIDLDGDLELAVGVALAALSPD